MSHRHLDPLPETFEGRRRRSSTSPSPDSETAVRVSCSMADHAGSGSLWPVDPSRAVRPVTTLGNQTWTDDDGDRVVNGSVAQFVTDHDAGAVLVVGHTACSVVADAYDRYVDPVPDVPSGVRVRLAPLVSLVERAVDEGVVTPPLSPRTVRHRLVEYNVVRQVAFLAGRLPSTVTVVGYVHDQDGVYGDFPGRHAVVSVDGHTGTDAIRSRVPDDGTAPVASVLR